MKCIPEHRVHFLSHFYDLYFKLKCIHVDILQNRIINVAWIQIDSFKTINIFCIKCNKHQLFDYKWLFLYICYDNFFFRNFSRISLLSSWLIHDVGKTCFLRIIFRKKYLIHHHLIRQILQPNFIAIMKFQLKCPQVCL